MADLFENNAAGEIHIRENPGAAVGGASGATLLLLSPPIIQAISRGKTVRKKVTALLSFRGLDMLLAISTERVAPTWSKPSSPP